MEKFKTSFNGGIEYQSFTQDGQNFRVTSLDNKKGATPAASV